MRARNECSPKSVSLSTNRLSTTQLELLRLPCDFMSLPCRYDMPCNHRTHRIKPHSHRMRCAAASCGAAFVLRLVKVQATSMYCRTIITAWLVREWTLPFLQMTSMQKAHSSKTLQLRCPRQLARQMRASWVAAKPDNSLESSRGRSNTPSRLTYLVAAYTRHVTGSVMGK